MKSTTRRKVTHAGRVLFAVFFALLIVGAAGLIWVLSDGGKTELKTFYVQTPDRRIIVKDEELILSKGENRFAVGYVLGFVQKGFEATFGVRIVPDPDRDFEFLLDGGEASFLGTEDLTECFDLKTEGMSFTLTVTGEETLESVLKKRYPGQEVAGVPEGGITNGYFCLVLSSFDGSAQLVLPFCIYSAVTGIGIDPGEAIF